MPDTARDQAKMQAESICAMVDALNVDYDRMEELRELKKTPRFVAGWNMPGYMPDSEPASFDDADSARGYIADEMELCSDDESTPEDDASELREAAERVRTGSGEYGQTVGAYHYWVTQDGNMLEPENEAELEELDAAAGECTSTEEAERRINEDPLSVEFRSGWVSVGGEMTPEEFRIVLCTGGPHVEIVGNIDLHGDPSSVRILYRGWDESGELFDFDHDKVTEYCRRFIML